MTCCARHSNFPFCIFLLKFHEFWIVLLFKWAIVETRYRDMRIEDVFDNTSFFFGENFWVPENISRCENGISVKWKSVFIDNLFRSPETKIKTIFEITAIGFDTAPEFAGEWVEGISDEVQIAIGPGLRQSSFEKFQSDVECRASLFLQFIPDSIIQGFKSGVGSHCRVDKIRHIWVASLLNGFGFVGGGEILLIDSGTSS